MFSILLFSILFFISVCLLTFKTTPFFVFFYDFFVFVFSILGEKDQQKNGFSISVGVVLLTATATAAIHSFSASTDYQRFTKIISNTKSVWRGVVLFMQTGVIKKIMHRFFFVARIVFWLVFGFEKKRMPDLFFLLVSWSWRRAFLFFSGDENFFFPKI